MNKSDIITFAIYVWAESYRNLDMSIHISRFATTVRTCKNKRMLPELIPEIETLPRGAVRPVITFSVCRWINAEEPADSRTWFNSTGIQAAAILQALLSKADNDLILIRSIHVYTYHAYANTQIRKSFTQS